MGSRKIILLPDSIKEKTVLGLDCSSKTVGWGLLSFDPITVVAHGHFNPLPSKYDFLKRLSNVFDCIEDLCNELQPNTIAVEDIIQHMSGPAKSMAQTITILAAFNRVASLSAWRKTNDVYFYPVSTIRKIIRQGINRKIRIDKEEIPTIIRTHLCPNFSNMISKTGKIADATMDEADGIAVAWAHLIETVKNVKSI